MDEQTHSSAGNTPPPLTTPPTKPPRTGIKKHLHSLWEVVRFAAIALIIVIPIRAFIAQPFVVSGTSMVPTFENGDYLIVDEISYRFEAPRRGDVIVFKYPKDTTKYFIKRIIGLPGETVEIKGSAITIYNAEHPEGFLLDEPYIKNKAENYSKTVVAQDDYYVMGDNRPASADSRFWGLLPRKLITGRVLVQLLPAKHMALFPGEHIFAD